MKLFLGCSHSVGFHKEVTNQYTKVKYWGDNCYPIIWARENNEQVIVYASPGAGNYRYPEWIKSMLDRYNITEIYIQSTYWDRFGLALSKMFSYGFDYYNTDYFLRESEQTEHYISYIDDFARDDAMELYMKSNGILPEFKGVNLEFGDDNSNVSDVQKYLMDEESFRYTKVFYEMFNHIQYRNYMRDMVTINHLCEANNAKAFVWRINERQDMPDNFNLYGDLKNITFCRESAESWIKKNKNLDIKHKTVDDEHYNNYVHRIIATEYLPTIFNIKKEKKNG